MTKIQQRLKAVNAKIQQLSAESKRWETQREKLTQQDRLDRAKRAGVAVGGYYRAIPIENGGDVQVGRIKKIDTNHWRSNVHVTMLVPANGRFRERVIFVDLDKYEFEKTTAPRKVK